MDSKKIGAECFGGECRRKSDKVTNELVLERIGEKRTLLNNILVLILPSCGTISLTTIKVLGTES